MKSTFPILNELESAASRLDRLGKRQVEIAALLGVADRTVRRALVSAANKRVVIARIARLGLLGRSVDEIIEEVSGATTVHAVATHPVATRAVGTRARVGRRKVPCTAAA